MAAAAVTVKMASDGMWQGENPLDFALPLLALQVAVILVITQGLALALKPLRQPRVVAEILEFSMMGLHPEIIQSAMADEIQHLTRAFSGLVASAWTSRRCFGAAQVAQSAGEAVRVQEELQWLLQGSWRRHRENLMVMWAMHPWERDARLAHHVLHQAHPAAIVVEIACTRTAEELLGARKAYQALFHHSLEEDVAYRARDKPYCGLQPAYNNMQLLTDVDLANARERLEHLLKQPANKFCADCGTPDPKWAKKYEFQQFVTDPQFSCPLRLNTKHAPDKNQQQQNCSARHGFGHAFRNSWKRKDTDNKGLKKMTDVGMVEFVGLIKVDIRRGTNLAVRDVMSSDPYVMLNLGHQLILVALKHFQGVKG
ncbi:hypothetical protein OsI_19774 [Oryza sativa Indica Group]|uniref:Uncharacterized protein n=1 Tax=Oryza sativa subsp. indica TaxID=39946 RepID=B8AXS0_ORYSI|nr:hypothetical protein OsI_19774 [Oryza sativa Indica Group]